ncbi:hypothetical protein [Streptomyces sp. NPDC051219]|uniref:hypothetical protein n=1 Tax=Streptomyces sp. NPDC051219 TaxID=3155283 RepID=UPI00344451C8
MLHRLKVFTAATAVTTIAGLALSGCSAVGDSDEAVPELPQRLCWGAFAGSEVAPLLPGGEEADVRGAAVFDLADGKDTATCTLYIDGNTKFQATARRQGTEDEVDWSSYEKAKPDPVDVGKKGIVWSNGAAAYFVCEGAGSSAASGSVVELSLSTVGSPDEEKVRSTLPSLMRKFVGFAQRELDCS